MPSMSTGGFSSGAGASGRLTSSHAPAARRSDLPTGAPSSSTPPASASRGRRGAGQAEQPGQPGVDAHARQPLGDRHRTGRHQDGSARRRVRACRVVCSAPAARLCRRAVRPAPPGGVEVVAEQRQPHQQDRPTHHRRVGDVEHRPPADGQEVDDVAAQRARRAEEPVDQVAERTAEDHPQPERPPRRDQPPSHPGDADHHTGGDQRQHPGVAGGHRERGAGVAHQRPRHGVADDRTPAVPG